MKTICTKLKIITVALFGMGMAWANTLQQEEETKLWLTQGYYFVSVSDPCHLGPVYETFSGPLCTYGGIAFFGKLHAQAPDCNIRLYQPYN